MLICSGGARIQKRSFLAHHNCVSAQQVHDLCMMVVLSSHKLNGQAAVTPVSLRSSVEPGMQPRQATGRVGPGDMGGMGSMDGAAAAAEA